jgi:hypothetical protein
MATTEKQKPLDHEEWRYLAILANEYGYQAGWRSAQRSARKQVSQETIKERGLKEMQQSALAGHLASRLDTRNVWLHNFYRGFRFAQFGGPEGEIYPGYQHDQGFVDGDDYIPEKESEAQP